VLSCPYSPQVTSSSGDIPVQNKTFQSFYVILGCGIVGIYFSMFTNDVMEAQEEVLKNKLVKAAVVMNKMAEDGFNRMRDAQRQQHQQFLE